MNTDKKGILNLAEICARKGLTKFVLSPGSRCAPLVIALNRHPQIECLSIVDERSAAFFALGMAQQLKSPVGLVCTSGSAVLNYAPAIAEAFYQKIPLLVFTADRPNEWIDQGENQSINQYRIYNNFIKKSFSLPVQLEAEMDLWYSDRLLSEAINISTFPDDGPVHVNIPLREPLYNLQDHTDSDPPKIITTIAAKPEIAKEDMETLKSEWKRCSKKLIVAGATSKDTKLNKLLSELANDPSVIVLTESISNLRDDRFISCIDPLVEIISQRTDRSLLPDLVVSFGGAVVSKKLKFLFRKNQVPHHWHISASNDHWDTFQSLTRILVATPESIFRELASAASDTGTFQQEWLDLKSSVAGDSDDYMQDIPFSDFKVYQTLLPQLPNNANIQFGNSTPVRYANLIELDAKKNFTIHSNRGISGIDGQVSTAAGAAYVHKNMTICVTGDIGFFYDSNALWNKNLSENFRIIIINNQGGNIFRIIPGPDQLSELEQYFETGHQLNARHLAEMHGLPYYFCDTEEDLQHKLEIFFKPHAGRPAIMEIQTPNKLSAEVLRDYFIYVTKRDKAKHERVEDHQ